MYIYLLLLVVLSLNSFAHGGKTNAAGCHNDNKTKTKHCHRRPISTANSALYKAGKNKAGANKASGGYSRKHWPHWVDQDNDCQNTRAEILIRDSAKSVKFKRNKGCNVSWGEWFDPYTLQRFSQASDLDIDHIVPLVHAHHSGAQNWTKSQKRRFANDPDNLLAVEDNANQQKGGKAPHQWMPGNTRYHCTYLKKWQEIKAKYQLSASSSEATFIATKLRQCS